MISGAKTAKQHFSCIKTPLVGSPGDRVIDLVLPPSLHLLLGITANIVKALEEVAGEDFTSEFICETSGVLRTQYFGGCLNGNSCRQFIKSADSLETKARNKGKLFEVMPIVDLLRRFEGVIKSCFSHQLAPDYQERIDCFIEGYVSMELPITPKLHILWHHVPKFCASTGIGLALYSEQTLESSHHAFGNIWTQRYKKDRTSGSYGSSLLNCVVEFNSKRLV